MTARRNYLLLIFLTIVCVGAGFSQKSPLVISGSVSSVTVAGDWDSKGDRIFRKDPSFNVNIRWTYRNLGDETIIAPNPRFLSNCTKKVFFLEVPTADGKVLETADEHLIYRKDLWNTQLLRALDQDSPSERNFVMIEPGGTFETGSTINIKTGFHLEIKEGVGKRARDIETTIPKYSYFKIQFSVSNMEQLREAQRRWSRFGKLLLTDGDFFLETDVIINKVRD